jgi:hypothetical protein
VCARLMVVSEIAGRDAEVSLAENEHVIQALVPDRADEPLREGIPPRAVRRRENPFRCPCPSRGAEGERWAR